MFRMSLYEVAREAFRDNLIRYEGSKGSRCGKVFLKEPIETKHIETYFYDLWIMHMKNYKDVNVYSVSFIKKK